MSDRPSTFGGTWHRPPHDGRAHTAREAQDRAAYDNQPASGCGALLLSFLLFLIALTLGVAL